MCLKGGNICTLRQKNSVATNWHFSMKNCVLENFLASSNHGSSQNPIKPLFLFNWQTVIKSKQYFYFSCLFLSLSHFSTNSYVALCPENLKYWTKTDQLKLEQPADIVLCIVLAGKKQHVCLFSQDQKVCCKGERFVSDVP